MECCENPAQWAFAVLVLLRTVLESIIIRDSGDYLVYRPY